MKYEVGDIIECIGDGWDEKGHLFRVIKHDDRLVAVCLQSSFSYPKGTDVCLTPSMYKLYKAANTPEKDRKISLVIRKIKELETRHAEYKQLSLKT